LYQDRKSTAKEPYKTERALQNRKSPTKQKEPYKRALIISSYQIGRALQKSPTKLKEPYERALQNRKSPTKETLREIQKCPTQKEKLEETEIRQKSPTKQIVGAGVTCIYIYE